jgi:pyruvate-ferredoxin/flavodoxin oxidoreductase
MQHQKVMVDAGQWLLYRYNPERAEAKQNPLQLDTKSIKVPVEQFLRMENRFNQLLKGKADDDEVKELFDAAQQDVTARYQMYSYLASRPGV